MEQIEWKKDYEIGIEKIDLQHKNLIAILNQLNDFLSRGQLIPQEEIQNLLVNLVNYTVYHFDTEEDIMLRNNYPNTKDHQIIHEQFKSQIASFLLFYDQKNLEPSTISNFLKNWLLNHIAKEDIKLSSFLKTNGTL
jgi:hemerythrin-like metal-binding protein